MSVLLTDEAVAAAQGAVRSVGWMSAAAAAKRGLAAALGYHATEGRVALVEAVLAVVEPDCSCAGCVASERAHAEAVVTALFGPKDSPGG